MDEETDHDRITRIEVALEYLREEQANARQAILDSIEKLSSHWLQRCDLRHTESEKRELVAVRLAEGEHKFSLQRWKVIAGLLVAMISSSVSVSLVTRWLGAAPPKQDNISQVKP